MYLCVCMYVCMYKRRHVMNVCIHVYMFVCLYVYVCMY